MIAGVRFVREKLKNYFIPVEEILSNRNDTHHIKPKDYNDFNPKKLYYVYWCYCEGSECTGTSKLCKYNKAYIFGLGENEEEILKKYEKAGTRISFRTRKNLSDTSSDQDSQSLKLQRQASKILALNVMTQNSERTKENFKHVNFMKKRSKLVISPSTSDQSEQAIGNFHNNVTVVRLPSDALNRKGPAQELDGDETSAASQEKSFSKQNKLLQQRSESCIKGIEVRKNHNKVGRSLFTEKISAPQYSTASTKQETLLESDGSSTDYENSSPSMIRRSSSTKKCNIKNNKIVRQEDNVNNRPYRHQENSFSKQNKLLQQCSESSIRAIEVQKNPKQVVRSLFTEKMSVSQDSTAPTKQEMPLESDDSSTEYENSSPSMSKRSSCTKKDNIKSNKFVREEDDANSSSDMEQLLQDNSENSRNNYQQRNSKNKQINENANGNNVNNIQGENEENNENANANDNYVYGDFGIYNNNHGGEEHYQNNIYNNEINDDGDIGFGADVVPMVDDASTDSDSNLEDEGYTYNEMQNDHEWGHIRMYKYRLFKYLNKLPARPVEPPLENEPEIYSEENNMVYLGNNVSVASLSWKMLKCQKDDLFLRGIGIAIWTKTNLSNRCFEIGKVMKSIPGRSPVKIITPRKLNHFLRIYRDHLVSKYYGEDKIKFYMRKATWTLSYQIRDLRQKAIKKGRRQARRAARQEN